MHGAELSPTTRPNMTQVSAPTDLRPLTALRFMAALWVVVFSFWPHLSTDWQPALVSKGYLGVELFFVLSGFILSHVYLERFGTKNASYRAFVWARLARIYPLQLATLLGVMALGLVAGAVGISISENVLDWKSFIANVFMVHAWGFTDTAGWNHPSWSVSAEWFAYLGFPAFALVSWKLKDRPYIALLLAAVFLVGLYEVFPRLAGFKLTEATYHWGILRIVPAFGYGCALYLAFRKGGAKRPVLLSALALAMLVFSAAFIDNDALIVLSAGSLIAALACLSNKQAGPIASAPAVWLGEISYAIYMCCAPWLMVSTNLLARLTGNTDKKFNLLIWLIIIAGLIAFAAVAHHLIERPARRFLRRVGPQQPT